MSDLGISPQQAQAMGTLKPGEPMPMSALAEALHCDNSNITGIVDRLEAAGLAERRPDARDRRVKAVVLTKDGEQMQIEIERRAGEPPPTIASLSAEDAIALRDILTRALGEE
jgi:DNA-binding MarR family transcriptional regulator